MSRTIRAALAAERRKDAKRRTQQRDADRAAKRLVGWRPSR